MANTYLRFLKDVVPRSRLYIGEVISHNSDGTSTVQLLDGGSIRARGQGVAVSSKAYVKSNVIEGEAPNLPVYNLPVV